MRMQQHQTAGAFDQAHAYLLIDLPHHHTIHANADMHMLRQPVTMFRQVLRVSCSAASQINEYY